MVALRIDDRRTLGAGARGARPSTRGVVHGPYHRVIPRRRRARRRRARDAHGHRRTRASRPGARERAHPPWPRARTAQAPVGQAVPPRRTKGRPPTRLARLGCTTGPRPPSSRTAPPTAASAVLHDALDALVSSDHRVPDETHPTSDTSDNHQVVAAPSLDQPRRRQFPESDRRGGSRARHQTRRVRTRRHALVSGGGGTLRRCPRGGPDGVRGEQTPCVLAGPRRGEFGASDARKPPRRAPRPSSRRRRAEFAVPTRQGEPLDGRRGAERRRRETSSGEAEGQQECRCPNRRSESWKG